MLWLNDGARRQSRIFDEQMIFADAADDVVANLQRAPGGRHVHAGVHVEHGVVNHATVRAARQHDPRACPGIPRVVVTA